MNVLEVDISPNFTTSKTCVISFDLGIVPKPSLIPALRQRIPSITLGLGFLGHPAPWGMRLVTYSVKAESRQRVTPFHVLIGL